MSRQRSGDVCEIVPLRRDDRAPKRLCGIVYREANMEVVAVKIQRVALHRAPVCILGESGTGKELVAHAIHQLGPRAQEPFVSVNCASLSPQLVESELFGHERGAFTGAERTRLGAFEEAGKGTLFLDEVGDLAQEAQAKLLRVLENGEIRRVGAEGVRKVECRIITATHQKLGVRVAEGTFRRDLFHRLTVLPIFIPPLRQRRGDILPLAKHILEQAFDGKIVLTPTAVHVLQRHTFPGNVRELRNMLLRAVVFATEEGALDADDLVFRDHSSEEYGGLGGQGQTLAEIEAAAIATAIQRHGSHSAAARELRIARSTLIARVNAWRRRGDPDATPAA